MPAWLKAASSPRKSSWLILAARRSRKPCRCSTSSTWTQGGGGGVRVVRTMQLCWRGREAAPVRG